MKAPTAGEYLAQASLLRLLAVLGIVVAPHLTRMPIWISLGVVGIGIWRALVALRQWRLPSPWIRNALTIASAGGVYASYGHISGQNAGVALLVVMTALKLTEMRARRDVRVVILLAYFVLITHFLFSQELWTAAYLLICATAITATLAESNHIGGALPVAVTSRIGTRMLLESLPLMALLFVLFPRIPGPLWGLPSDAGVASSGLSDSMSPGDIASLIQSDEIAFRVTFDGAAPPMRERYWRGPSFDNFDGHRWKASGRMERQPPPVIQPLGRGVRYEVTLEPHRRLWLFTLDVVNPASLPPKTRLRAAGDVISTELLLDRRAYEAVSHTHYLLQPELPDDRRTASLQLPRSGNSKTRELAKTWRDQGLDDNAIVQRALRWFHEEPFYYTLEPPRLGSEPVDEFLFDTRRGFCEHYASSFTFLMRAAGIPARVVTGYQGGERNTLGDYYVVRQSDAHAWSEVWLPGHGWVRIDPTAAVAPARIEIGISPALSQSGDLPAFLQRRSLPWRMALSERWDFINAKWNAWVLAYGPQVQMEFLSNFGLDDMRSMILALTVVTTMFLSIVGLILLRQSQAPPSADAALKLWNRALRRLARVGVVQLPHEGPEDFARRVAAARPQLSALMCALKDAYVRARYLGDNDAASLQALTIAVRALRI